MDPVSEFLRKPSFWNKFTESDLKSSEIRNFFAGKVIFITGATGFLGQLYVEKLLRCDVKHIYMLARSKKNKTAAERLDDIFKGVQFGILRKYDPNFMSRLTIVEGDLSEIGVGINEDVLGILCKEVDIIIHGAADVRFNQKLINLLLINLRGTRELLRLALTFKKLLLFAYVSTSFCNCPFGENILEKFYDNPNDPQTLIAYAESLERSGVEADNLEILTDRIISPWHNTYTFTKSLSEKIVRRFGEKIDIIIMRPSAVISTFQEPLPGWLNNIYAYTGYIYAIFVGTLRTMPINDSRLANIVCADFVVNSTLAAIWSTHEDNTKRLLPSIKIPQIYAVCSSSDRRINARKSILSLLELFSKYPAKRTFWKALCNFTTNSFILKYYSIMFHFLPAMIFDSVMRLTGNKLRMLSQYRKLHIFLITTQYFLINNWIFDNRNMHSVLNRMTHIDKELFLCDMREFDFFNWAITLMQGIKVYIANEKLDETSLLESRRKYSRLQIAHIFIKVTYYGIIGLLIYGVAIRFGLFGLTNRILFGEINRKTGYSKF